ncbi:hypothetical protein A5662_12050 [Mycobacteriaceae bacterium 1482268.1]|nr:hypothetical protein A5662_12050 [Mycobacteriaceae bacterium 1482268.1]
MSFGYQQQFVLDSTAARAAILNLNARHNRFYSNGDRTRWAATFKHSGATLTIDGQTHNHLRSAFDGGRGRLLTVNHDIVVDGVNATQSCVAVLLSDNAQITATGGYTDTLIYERGGWYYASRTLDWDTAFDRVSVDA